MRLDNAAWFRIARALPLAAAMALVSMTPCGATQAPQSTGGAAAQAPTAQSAADWRMRRGLYYKRNWGVEIIGVKPGNSGYMLVFRYRILDPEKAKILNDKQATAYLIDEATGIRLAVPSLENVGEMRTGAPPESGRTYFMMFGNPGKLVKSGSRVSVVVGNFHVDGLIVD